MEDLDPDDLQARCEAGQRLLMEMEYIEAEKTLAAVEAAAWEQEDWDTLARLYMPLQEARRQRRQRCGEGVMCLNLLAEGNDDVVDARHVLENFPQGQLLVAGWGNIEPARHLRQLQGEFDLYVETFLAAVYPIGHGQRVDGRAVVIVPHAGVQLPAPDPRSIDELLPLLPAHCIVMNETELPQGSQTGTHRTYGYVMALWERLHAPFLAAADMQVDAKLKMAGYRMAIAVDYACELAHQKLADCARNLDRAS